jgi:hypothetical protein
MATTKAHQYGAEIAGDVYVAQFKDSEGPATMNYTGGTHTQDGRTGHLFSLDKDPSGDTQGKGSATGGRYQVVFIDTSDGIVVEEEPI